MKDEGETHKKVDGSWRNDGPSIRKDSEIIKDPSFECPPKLTQGHSMLEHPKNAVMPEEDYVRRPMNAFMVWSRSERRKLALKYPNMLNCEISKLLGAEWSKMSENDKKPYILESKKLRTIHSQKYPEYSYRPRRKKRKQDSSGISNRPGVAMNPNGVQCYGLQNNEFFDNSYASNGSYNSYGYYYDQNASSNFMPGVDSNPTYSQNSIGLFSNQFNRIDSKIPQYYPAYTPNNGGYNQNFSDNVKLMPSYGVQDNSQSSFSNTNYFANMPFANTPASQELYDRNTPFSFPPFKSLFTDINTSGYEKHSSDNNLVANYLDNPYQDSHQPDNSVPATSEPVNYGPTSSLG